MPVPKLEHSEDQISQNNKKCQSKLNDEFLLNIKTICQIYHYKKHKNHKNISTELTKNQHCKMSPKSVTINCLQNFILKNLKKLTTKYTMI